MNIVKLTGYQLELTEDEMEIVREIAVRNNCTVEKAVQLSIQNFLKQGVQTPESEKKSA